MPENKYKICFPHMGNYYPAFLTLAEVLTCEIVPTPPISKRTIELGFKNSPESVCIPFKYNLGNYIEALDKGANIILQAGGGCRFGYYAEVQEAILKSLGYKFELLKLNNSLNPLKITKEFKRFNPNLTMAKFAYTFSLAYQKARWIEQFEEKIRLNIGFEVNPGEYEKLFKKFLKDLVEARKISLVRRLGREYREKFGAIPIDKPKNPLRVGLVGELYVVMEPFSNFDIEKKLGKRGIEVHRFVTISNIINDFFLGQRPIKHWLRDAKPYLKYHIGAHGSESVAVAHKLAKDGFDGLIHVKPFGCMPEVNAMTALHRVSRDYKFPIIYFSFDSQTSETGINTRLEAFYDMLVMKRKKK
ncbi:MAG: hypothetical protein NTW50_02405 [Candidatus Berkelbacteria bacterium]|nr:hypothetical protein [Candidatus Berkelbacteria bacterium]